MSDSEKDLFEQSERIKEKLAQLKESDKNFQNFGAFVHKYELNKTLSEKEISEFEKEYQIALPKEYRYFLKHFGNGGCGPFYGVVKLEDSLFSDMDLKKEDDKTNPALPFPHTEPQMMAADSIEDEEEAEKYFEQWIEPKHTQGILRLSNYGCGVFVDLVVNGEEYGNMWTSDLGNDAGIFPSGMLKNEPQRINFLDWYELWLDNSLQKMESNNYEKPVSSGFSGQGFGGIKKFLRKYFRL